MWLKEYIPIYAETILRRLEKWEFLKNTKNKTKYCPYN